MTVRSFQENLLILAPTLHDKTYKELSIWSSYDVLKYINWWLEDYIPKKHEAVEKLKTDCLGSTMFDLGLLNWLIDEFQEINWNYKDRFDLIC